VTPLPVEVLVEEPSAETALRLLLPRIIPDVPFALRVFQGKHDLLKKLPNLMKGYVQWPGVAAARVVVLIDRDDEDCHTLRSRLDTIATDAGFVATGSLRQILNRIAVEELEAWFIGDISAVTSAFPRVPAATSTKSVFRNPDAVIGGTWEAFERLLQKHGYCKNGLAKIGTASAIATYMDVEKNESRSFQVFRDGLRKFVSREDF